MSGSSAREYNPQNHTGAVHVYDSVTCRLLCSLEIPGPADNFVTALDWSRDGRLIATGSHEDKTVSARVHGS